MCNIKLKYSTTNGQELFDIVKYTFIAANCGDQPKTSPNNVRNRFKNAFSKLVHCEWSITAPATSTYNCIAWSVGEINNWYNPKDIDKKYGNNDGIFDTSDMDAFF